MKLSEYQKASIGIPFLNSYLALKSFLAVSFIFFSILLISGSIGMNAQVPARRNRPATVPQEYVVTPFGYLHPTCLKRLSKGDVLLKGERAVRHANGNFDSFAVCGYPRYDAKGKTISGTPVQGTPLSQGRTPTIGGWVEDYTVTTGTSFAELNGNWIVPATPTSNDGQTLFFFTGLIESGDGYGSILQPVLAWNEEYENSGDPTDNPTVTTYENAWSIASWNCCVYGNAYYSTPEAASSGDTIVGTIQSTCGAGVLTCSSWDITTEDLDPLGTLMATTTLSTSDIDNLADPQTFNQAFAGTVEVYGVTQCSDYPPDGSITFSNVALYDYNFSYISGPGWSLENRYSGLSPQCYYGGETPAADQVVLNYGLPAPVMTEYTFHSPFGDFSSVGMTDGNPSAAIYYTTNGTTPTTSSNLYTGSVSYTSGETFEAIAVIGSGESAVTTTLIQHVFH